MFLIERAAAAPDAYLLGVEIKSKWAYKVARRCERLGLSRVRPYAGDARAVLASLTPDGVLSRVFLHFPDPWWKKRHAKRRLMGEEVLDLFARLLKPGGQVYIQTDVEERAAAYVEQLGAHPAFALDGDGGYLDANPFGARSNREKRADEDGLPVFRVLGHRT
jgi:tRNA (guanine-N7-)-methyltransferase